MRFRGVARAAVASLTIGAAVPALAQVTPTPTPPPAAPPLLPSQSDISRARIGLPAPEAPTVDLSIQAPERSAVPKAVDTIDFDLKSVVVEGATAFSRQEVDGFFASLVGRTVQLEAVRVAAAALEEHYRERGYFLTRVFVPPQRVTGGALTIRVVEGYIDKIQVEGLDATARAQVEGILRPLAGKKPIDLASVERRLLILNDLPGLTAASVLRQGSTLGASDLRVTLAAQRSVVQASISNTNSRLLGPWVYALNGNLVRPLGLPGALALGVSASGPGFGATQSGSWRYSLGLGHGGLVGSIGQIVARAHPGASLTPLDVHNDVLSTSLRLRYPLIRSRRQSLFLEGGLSINQSSTEILQQQLVDDHDTVVDVALTYQQSGWLKGSTSASIDLYHGLPILGAIGRDAPRPSVLDFNPSFARLTYSLQRVQVIASRVSALAAVQGQYSGSKLLSGELVAFGGPSIGRGYDPSTITGDRGIGGVAELRYDLPVGKPWLANAQFYGFIDHAHTTTLASAFADRTSASLSSAGGGVRLGMRYVSVDLSLAKAFRRFGGTDMRGDPRALLTIVGTY